MWPDKWGLKKGEYLKSAYGLISDAVNICERTRFGVVRNI